MRGAHPESGRPPGGSRILFLDQSAAQRPVSASELRPENAASVASSGRRGPGRSFGRHRGLKPLAPDRCDSGNFNTALQPKRNSDLGLGPILDSKNSDSDDSSEGLEERPLPVLSLAPAPPLAPPSPPSPPVGLDPCAPAPAAASSLQKPKIWSLAETATSPDNPRRSPPSAGGGSSPGAAVASPALQLSPAAAAAHRLVSGPLGKFPAWTNRPFAGPPPGPRPHPLSLLGSAPPHLLGLPGAAGHPAAAFARPAEPEGGTDRCSALEMEKKLLKTAFQPVARRPQNHLDAALVLSALSSS
ncbi:iroquois-class homeodomain protein IRX-3 [Echinops telfairi]|uniref:Iroquois-class homeodomain protein IRX-3 n=1 Tax=Echinops telfairi TaxID=9371 RepID=A0ABM0IPP9_ECHTE|nr:iroquois-class homeodomain protein IRX-3 [Echinops telfairi]